MGIMGSMNIMGSNGIINFMCVASTRRDIPTQPKRYSFLLQSRYGILQICSALATVASFVPLVLALAHRWHAFCS